MSDLNKAYHDAKVAHRYALRTVALVRIVLLEAIVLATVILILEIVR